MKKALVLTICFFLVVGVLSFLGISASASTESASAVTVNFVQEYPQPGVAFQVKLEGNVAGCTVNWFVDGKQVGTGTSYTPAKSDIEKMISA